MKDRLERFVLLPFTAGCISESSIPVVMPKRSKQGTNSPPTEKDDEKEDEEEGFLDEEDRLSGQNLKSSNLPRFQKLFKNFKDFSQLFVYKDGTESDTGMEIGLPTEVKHVTHIGLDNLDGCRSSIFSNGWKNLAEQELINLHSFPLPELELALKGESPNIKSSLEARCLFDNSSTAMRVMDS